MPKERRLPIGFFSAHVTAATVHVLSRVSFITLAFSFVYIWSLSFTQSYNFWLSDFPHLMLNPFRANLSRFLPPSCVFSYSSSILSRSLVILSRADLPPFLIYSLANIFSIHLTLNSLYLCPSIMTRLMQLTSMSILADVWFPVHPEVCLNTRLTSHLHPDLCASL